jgi:glycosyltransferase involved in cell wall biosynthesis
MKILHLITGLGTGGTEKHLLKILPLMSNTTNIVCSLIDKNEIGKKLEEKGIKVYYLLGNVFKKIIKFKNIIKNEKPDILCTYLIHSDLFGRLFGRLFGIKKIICNIRVVHNKGYFNEVGRLLIFLERLTSILNTMYITNSNTTKQSLKINKNKIKVIYNGIDLQTITNINVNKLEKRKLLELEKDDFVIVCVGRLHEQKGQQYLIEAINMLYNKKYHIKCLFLGEGSKRQEYEDKISKLKLNDKIKLLGNRVDAIEILKISDVFVLPTNYEGMSNAIIEAMACKIPIITTNIPENKELIIDSINGILVNNCNSEEIFKAIEKIMLNKKIGIELSKNAFNDINKYDINICSKKFEEEYQKCVE